MNNPSLPLSSRDIQVTANPPSLSPQRRVTLIVQCRGIDEEFTTDLSPLTVEALA